MAKGKKFAPEIWKEAQDMYESGRRLELIALKTGIALNTLKNNIKHWESPKGLTLNTDTAIDDLENAYATWAHEITKLKIIDYDQIHKLSVAIKNCVSARLGMLDQQMVTPLFHQLDLSQTLRQRLIEKLGETEAAPILAILDELDSMTKTSLEKIKN